MADIKTALTALILGDAGVSALVGNRVHWLRLPDGVDGLPYLILQGVGDEGGYTLDGDMGLDSSRVQIDVYAGSQLAAWDIERAMRALLSGYSGTVGGVEIQWCQFLTRRDMPPVKVAAAEWRSRSTADYRFRWKLAP